MQPKARILTRLLILLCCAVALQAVPVLADDRARPASPVEKPIFSLKSDGIVASQTEKVADAGKSIGKGIDRFSQKAARHVGGWVNTEALFGITWLKMLLCLLLVFSVVVMERVLQLLIQSKLKNGSAIDETAPWGKLFLRALSKPLTLFVWVYGIYLAISPLFAHFQSTGGKNTVQLVVQKAADIGGTIALIWFLFRLVDLMDVRLRKWAAKTESTIDDMLAPLAGKTLRIFILAMGGIILIQNLTGIEIGPLLASLGLGGLAFALAAKDSVANFFGTMTIFFDKPFQVGERIVISGYDGTVESVGFRSTRIRTLTGSLVTIPNENVINTSVENIGRRPNIRWLTNITVTYDTPPDKVERAVEIIRRILDNHEGMHPDWPPRVYFNGFNDWSLNILVVAWYHPPNWWDYCEWLQKTCLDILTDFNREGIDFAFPSRTVYHANDDKRQLALRMLKGDRNEG